MNRQYLLAAGLAAVLAGATAARAQEIPPPRQVIPPPRQVIPQPPDVNPPQGEEMPQPAQEIPQPGQNLPQPETDALAPDRQVPATDWRRSRCRASSLKTFRRPPTALRLGPTAVSNVRFLMDNLGLENCAGRRWASEHSAGSKEATPAPRLAPGLLSVQPRQNRFGDQFLLNQIGLVLQKPLRQDQFDLGFNIRYFAGADAALGQPKGGIGYPVGNSHFGQDFRDLYLSAHLPIVTEGGVDFKFGRMNTIIGYNGFLAPYRPFYSSDYQFFYSQDGAFTGFLTDLHVNNRLDIWNGMTLGRQHVLHLAQPETRSATSARSITGCRTKRARG